MENIIFLFVIIPLIGFLLTLFPENRNEKPIFWIAISTVALHALIGTIFTANWLLEGCPNIAQEGVTLYKSHETDFSINFFFDYVTAVYGSVATFLTFLVLIFSRYYMHREQGFKRFFNNVLFFYLGLNAIIFAGNFETLFIGWEIIGVTSFFLIGFYRDRYLPIKNALKVLSIYRLADISLLMGIGLCHHFFHRSIAFGNLHSEDLAIYFTEAPVYQLVIPFIFLIAALVKSAQLPFSSWLPRAMEGPTTSSAIFYGSLSVHIGVFLLMRMFPLWEDSTVFRAVVFGLGLLSSLVATSIASVQSSVKTQIAYASIAQIGIMFMEVALGWFGLALIHFAGNAFLRTYQLLVSPSVLNYLIHDQFFHFIEPNNKISPSFWGKIRSSLYILSIKEGNFDGYMYRFLWQPLKELGNALAFLSNKFVLGGLILGYWVGLYFVAQRHIFSEETGHYLTILFAFVALLLILRAFVERQSALLSWSLIVMNQLFVALALAFNQDFSFSQIYIYLSGIVVSAIIGYYCFYVLSKAKETVDLTRFYGHSYEYPRLSTLFMLACLGLSGFPITPTFIGEDLIISHINENQFVLTALIALSFVLDGLAIYRIYARVFMGQHVKTHHESAFRSS